MSRALNIALFIAVVLIGYGMTARMDQSPPKITLAEQPPLTDFSFTDITGQKHALSDYDDKIIIINFWATWCPPCIVEFPALLDLAAKNKNIVLIALSSDRNEDDIKKFITKFKPSENVLIAHDKDDVTLKLFGISQLPETIIAAPGLTPREKLVGAEWKPHDVQKIIDSIRP